MPLRNLEADLDKCPSVIDDILPHVRVGDLHGNALKLLYVLIQVGVLTVTEKQYNQLRDIYKKPVNQLRQSDIDTFKATISTLQVSAKTAITLIGDELADRGNNDYFTLLILKKLFDGECNVHILLSNHSLEFIKDYEKQNFTGHVGLSESQGQSLVNMHQLIIRGLIHETEVRDIVERSYIPMVEAIGYTNNSSDDKINLSFHAPNGLEVIQALAKCYNVHYKDDSNENLFKTIDTINSKICKELVDKKLGTRLDQEIKPGMNYDHISVECPLNRLIWNRELGTEFISHTSSNKNINIFHGHNGPEETSQANTGQKIPAEIQNLDCYFGKFPEFFITRQIGGTDVTHIISDSQDVPNKLDNEKLKAIYWTILYKKYNEYIQRFQDITNELKVKYGEDHSAVIAGNILTTKLKEQGRTLLSNKNFELEGSYTECVEKIKCAIDEANKEFKKHRGFGALNPVLRQIIGILTIFPMLKALVTGRSNTFFGNPATRSSAKLKEYSRSFQRDIRMMKDAILNKRQSSTNNAEDQAVGGNKPRGTK